MEQESKEAEMEEMDEMKEAMVDRREDLMGCERVS
jgi:hypothetical protein